MSLSGEVSRSSAGAEWHIGLVLTVFAPHNRQALVSVAVGDQAGSQERVGQDGETHDDVKFHLKQVEVGDAMHRGR